MATLVISDVHLCGVVPSSDGAWMFYRQRENQIDSELASLIDSVRGATIVLNGDVFDLDAPDMRYGSIVRNRSEAASAVLLAAILDDHTPVVRVLRQAASVVVIPGNHDAQLAYPMVRRVLVERLGTHVRFESLFYTTPDGFHVEHGHQYDPLCSNDGPAGDSIGTVATFYTPLIFGCSSPYASDPGDTNWIDGLCGCASTEMTMRFMRDLLLVGPSRRSWSPAHGSLFAPKTLANEVIEQRAWKNYGDEACRRLRTAQSGIASIYGSRGVVMGHTHVPFGETVGGVFYGNSGSWVKTNGSDPSFVWIEDGQAETRYWR